MQFPSHCRSFVACFAVSLFLSGPGLNAQYAPPSQPEVHRTADQILAALSPDPNDTRGLGRIDAPNGQAQAPDTPKATLLVEFEAETDRLTVQGMRTLQQLALAMQQPQLQGASFQIASHAFAEGDPQLQVRTTRRAQVIAEHLAGFYNIDIYRLNSIGMGAQMMINTQNWTDPINNRIEVFNMSAG